MKIFKDNKPPVTSHQLPEKRQKNKNWKLETGNWGLNKGFTLIELLVVVTLLAILAVAVWSALNPLEQVNKARDSRNEADASQLLAAIERYYTGNFSFPWVYYADFDSDDDEFVALANYVGVGVCGNTDGTEDPLGNAVVDTFCDTNGCTNDGLLVERQELKTQFGGRASFKDVANQSMSEKLILFKPDGSHSISICFVPNAKGVRDTAGTDTTTLQYFTGAWAADGAGNTLPSGGVIERCDSGHAADFDWTTDTMSDKCYICVPEE